MTTSAILSSDSYKRMNMYCSLFYKNMYITVMQMKSPFLSNSNHKLIWSFDRNYKIHVYDYRMGFQSNWYDFYVIILICVKKKWIHVKDLTCLKIDVISNRIYVFLINVFLFKFTVSVRFLYIISISIKFCINNSIRAGV